MAKLKDYQRFLELRYQLQNGIVDYGTTKTKMMLELGQLKAPPTVIVPGIVLWWLLQGQAKGPTYYQIDEEVFSLIDLDRLTYPPSRLLQDCRGKRESEEFLLALSRNKHKSPTLWWCYFVQYGFEAAKNLHELMREINCESDD